MTTSNDDQTTQLPEFDVTTPLPTTPAPSVGQDATVEMPTSSPDLSSDPLAIFREAPTTQMPADPFRADAGAESQAGAPGAQGSQAQAGTPAGSVGTSGRTAFDPASTGESAPRGHEAGAAPGAQARAGASPAPGTQTWSAQSGLGATYPLPEAQLDRFLLKLELPLPSREAENDIIARHQAGFSPMALAEAGIRPVASATDIQAAHAVASHIEVSPAVMAYLVDLCRATRTSPAVRLGVSPRGATALLRTSRVWAFLQGRGFVTPDDVKTMAPVTLAHRLGLRAEANLEGVTATDVIAGVLAATPVPR